MQLVSFHSHDSLPPDLLSRFQSSNDPDDPTSLEEYVERMKEKQDHIYFVAGPNRADAEASPFVERLLRKGYEVLYLVDPVDEYCVQNLPEFEGKKFQVRDGGGGDVGQRERYRGTCQSLRGRLGMEGVGGDVGQRERYRGKAKGCIGMVSAAVLFPPCKRLGTPVTK